MADQTEVALSDAVAAYRAAQDATIAAAAEQGEARELAAASELIDVPPDLPPAA